VYNSAHQLTGISVHSSIKSRVSLQQFPTSLPCTLWSQRYASVLAVMALLQLLPESNGELFSDASHSAKQAVKVE